MIHCKHWEVPVYIALGRHIYKEHLYDYIIYKHQKEINKINAQRYYDACAYLENEFYGKCKSADAKKGKFK